MQSFNTQGGLTDISNTAGQRVKLQEGKIEQPASQRSTMQSMGDVSNQGNEENILGTENAAFSSVADKKSGSLEHLSNVLKRPYLKRQSYSRKLAKGQKKAKKIQKDLGKKIERSQGKIEAFFRQKAQSLRTGAKGLQTARPAKLSGDLASKKFVLSFSAHEWNAGDRRAYLKRQTIRRRLGKPTQKKAKTTFKSNFRSQQLYRDRARFIRSGARRVLNQVPSAKGADRSSTDLAPNQWVLEFSSNEWNGGFFKAGKTSDESNPRKWTIEIPASEWNVRTGAAAKQRAGFLMSRAQGFMKSASIQATGAQKGAQRLYRKAVQGVRQFFTGKKPISK